MAHIDLDRILLIHDALSPWTALTSDGSIEPVPPLGSPPPWQDPRCPSSWLTSLERMINEAIISAALHGAHACTGFVLALIFTVRLWDRAIWTAIDLWLADVCTVLSVAIGQVVMLSLLVVARLSMMLWHRGVSLTWPSSAVYFGLPT